MYILYYGLMKDFFIIYCYKKNNIKRNEKKQEVQRVRQLTRRRRRCCCWRKTQIRKIIKWKEIWEKRGEWWWSLSRASIGRVLLLWLRLRQYFHSRIYLLPLHANQMRCCCNRCSHIACNFHYVHLVFLLVHERIYPLVVHYGLLHPPHPIVGRFKLRYHMVHQGHQNHKSSAFHLPNFGLDLSFARCHLEYRLLPCALQERHILLWYGRYWQECLHQTEQESVPFHHACWNSHPRLLLHLLHLCCIHLSRAYARRRCIQRWRETRKGWR